MTQLPVFLAALFVVSACRHASEASRPKVLGGKPKVSDSYQALVSIGSCSAVVVHKQKALTAKHCIEANSWREKEAVSVSYELKSGEAWQQTLTLTRIDQHPKQDLALLSFQESIPAKKLYSLHDKPLKGDEPVLIMGYGCMEFYIGGGINFPSSSPGYLQEAEASGFLPTAANYDKVSSFYVKGKSEDMLGDVKIEGPALCPGDSGGGLFFLNQGKEALIGINNSMNPYSVISSFTRLDPGRETRTWLDPLLKD